MLIKCERVKGFGDEKVRWGVYRDSIVKGVNSIAFLRYSLLRENFLLTQTTANTLEERE